MLSSFVHESNVNCCVDSLLHVDNVSMWVIASGQYHSAAGRDFQIELVKDALTLVQFAELRVQIVCNVKRLHWKWVVPDIPDVDWKVVSWEEVVVACRSKFCSWNGIDNVHEKVLSGGVLCLLKPYRTFVKLRRNPEIAIRQVSFWWAEKEYVRATRVVLYVRNHLWKLLNVRGL
jgi:hypothetical protein